MKISKRHLRRIIKEEKARILSEQISGSEEGAILGGLEDAASLFEAYADRYGSMEWQEEDDNSEEQDILNQLAGIRSLLESYFDQFGPQAFG